MAKRKQILNRKSFFYLDPKPSDLIMSRLKIVNNFWKIELVSVASEWDDL